MLYFALLDEVLDRSGHVFNRHVRVDAMLIEQIDGVDNQALEGSLDDLFDVLRPAIKADPLRTALGIELEYPVDELHFTRRQGLGRSRDVLESGPERRSQVAGP